MCTTAIQLCNNINRSSVLDPSETKRSLSVLTASSRARSVLKTRTISLPGSDTKRAVHFVLFFHRRAAPARFAAIPTWRRRWAVGALGARPDAYTLRRTEAALVPYNGLCHSYKRQGSVINACAQQGTVLQRHAPPQFLPIETRSLRVSRYGFM